MYAALIFALLVGPVPEPLGRVPLRIHLGRDHRSAVIRSELANDHSWFVRRRLAIGESYRLIVDDDENLEPSYQIGDERQRSRFSAGSFAASGSFILNLAEIGERWIADNRDYFDKSDGVNNVSATHIREISFQPDAAPPDVDFVPGPAPPPDVP